MADIKPTGQSSSVDVEDSSSLKGSVIDTSAVDVAAQYANQLAGEDAYTREEEVKLRWKLDFRLVPLLWFNITLAAMDKVTTAMAALYGLKEDTGLTGNRYSWVGSVFYFGYMTGCFPAGSLMQKWPIAKVMCVTQLLWGIVLIGTGFANNYPTLIALRVILGALEAPIVPGNYLLLGMFYPRREQPIRNGLMYTGLAALFKGPLGYAIGFINGGEHAWRYMFWVTGAITVVWSIVIGLFLPDNPVKAKFMSEREKAIAVERMRADQTGIENKQFKRDQFIETLVDPKTWLMFLFNLWISIPNGGLTNFSPLIIKGLGASSQKSALLSMPSGAIQTASSYFCNFGVFFLTKYHPGLQCRTGIILIGIMVGLIASVFLYTLPLNAFNSRLAAMYMSYFYLGPYILSLGLNVANTAGHTKKVTLNSIVFISYCISNIIGPQFFKEEQAPLYPLGIGAILGSYVLSVITIIAYAAYCIYENRRRDRIDSAAGERVHSDTDFKDLTDMQNPHFRYVW